MMPIRIMLNSNSWSWNLWLGSYIQYPGCILYLARAAVYPWMIQNRAYYKLGFCIGKVCSQEDIDGYFPSTGFEGDQIFIIFLHLLNTRN